MSYHVRSHAARETRRGVDKSITFNMSLSLCHATNGDKHFLLYCTVARLYTHHIRFIPFPSFRSLLLLFLRLRLLLPGGVFTLVGNFSLSDNQQVHLLKLLCVYLSALTQPISKTLCRQRRFVVVVLILERDRVRNVHRTLYLVYIKVFASWQLLLQPLPSAAYA